MEKWKTNDNYIANILADEDTALTNALNFNRQNNLPEAEISPAQGKFLYLLARIKGAKRILELGTHGGYSAIWLAKAVGDGSVVTIEYVEEHAAVARRNIENAGFSNTVKVICGDASEVMKNLIAAKEQPFDMIFIDADKPGYPLYLELSLQLSKPGTVIYGDNVIRDGELCNENNRDEKVTGVRKFIQNLGELQAIESTALQTVGIKGYDGFTLSVVK